MTAAGRFNVTQRQQSADEYREKQDCTGHAATAKTTTGLPFTNIHLKIHEDRAFVGEGFNFSFSKENTPQESNRIAGRQAIRPGEKATNCDTADHICA
ncbi:MAG: hypothetical protein ONB48_07440 [candidate division KSB1 bacterium]|nr:hypothetical protein [candidate division KSB1 bacterium]MDZ7274654.1 hypothetical protein [candidate division KSB1 bacterium]MDZ7285479.1 hypothetical protein [candidate division KSB1 bacterium]MDZ7298511.1 hypothetical protein [candidate division KSB1 bacterium]MDZ7306265.1 hypothetical protein [candidate division KSB1 bacterium]